MAEAEFNARVGTVIVEEVNVLEDEIVATAPAFPLKVPPTMLRLEKVAVSMTLISMLEIWALAKEYPPETEMDPYPLIIAPVAVAAPVKVAVAPSRRMLTGRTSPIFT